MKKIRSYGLKRSNIGVLGIVALLLVGLFLAGCSSDKEVTSNKVTGDTVYGDTAGSAVTIFKSASCGCCSVYADYVGKKGFDVEVNQVPDVAPIKEEYGIPSNMRSCHTTIVGDYFVEGHIPVEAIEKLMAEKPDIKGIAMPGMPSGSPGMPGSKKGDFVVYAVHNDGSVDEFMRI